MNKYQEILQELLKAGDIKLNGKRPFDIKVHDPRTYKKVITQRELGIGETYMDGWWTSDRLDETAARMLAIDMRRSLPVRPVVVKSLAVGVLRNRQKVNQAYKNARSHYNIGNDLYEAMLDKRMVYSCGFWERAKNLDAAQEAKLDRICKKLKLKKGMTLLDIGCGWGGLAQFAAANCGVRVTGISPADEQVKIAKARAKGLNVTILQKDYREMNGKFDRIVSVGMLEHVGRKNYSTFFQKCDQLLKDDGMMLHHFIGNTKSVLFTDPWINTYIFPNGYIPSLAQICKTVEPLFTVEDVENFGPDYDKTLMSWHKNFVKNYPKLKDKYDERFYRMWEYYLLTCAAAFRVRKLELYQIVMRKITQAETYRGYR